MYPENRVKGSFIGCYHMLFVLNNLLAHDLLIYLLKLFSLAYPSFFLCLVPCYVFLFAMITNCWCEQMWRPLMIIEIMEMFLCSLAVLVIALLSIFWKTYIM